MEFQKITGERARTYRFAAGELRVQNVVGLCVRPSGTHRLETLDGRKFIVPAGWLAIEVEADSWSA